MSACAVTTSKPPRLSYAPPSTAPGEPGSAYAGQPAGLIWNQLLDRLIQSPLEVDLADPERGIVVASYSGDPEPFVTCGWILVQRGNELEQVPASAEATFRRVVQGRRMDVSRGMKLDARLVVQVEPEATGAAVDTTSNYVLTKTILAEERGGRPRGRAHEVVSFSAGGRGEFSKGTVCQPNGALERIVLDVLPRMARVQPADGSQAAPSIQTADSSPPAPRSETIESGAPAPTASMAENGEPVATAQVQTAESAGPGSLGQSAVSSGAAPTLETAQSGGPALAGQTASAPSETPDSQAASAPSEVPDSEAASAPSEVPDSEEASAPSEVPDGEAASAPSEVPDGEVAELARAESPESANLEDGAVSLECPIADKVFCDVLAITDPYRRANQDRNLGLALEAIEGSNPLLGGSELGFDVSLPSYAAYLNVSFFLKDGTVRHVLSGWDRRWPAHAREFVSDAGLSTEDRASVEMVVALASDVPVFASPRPVSEAAELYLGELRKRLSELRDAGASAQIAASLLVVTPA